MNSDDKLETAFTDLQAVFSGTLLRPADEEYDAVRQGHNGLIDKRPALIACCSNTFTVRLPVSAPLLRRLSIALRDIISWLPRSGWRPATAPKNVLHLNQNIVPG